MKKLQFMDSPLGSIGICEDSGKITDVFFDSRENTLKDYEILKTPLLSEAVKELSEYFSGKRKVFELPLDPFGTEFMRKDWQMLEKIPYGETRCYEDIAISLGNPKACRAVGLANNKNPIAIIIPCHRVIGKNGSLVGYAGGLHLKKYLLELEGVNL